MTKLNKVGYSLKDVTIIQSPCSEVSHRGDVNPYTRICNREVLPIFIAPMATVTDETNYNVWIDNKLTPVIPRTVQQRLKLDERIKLSENTFVSFSLEEASELINLSRGLRMSGKKYYFCVDVAQGTMKVLIDKCKKLKELLPNCEIMTGNIANPEAYRYYCEAGIDWVRCSVGSGSRCISACNTAIYYPMATLLDEINAIREKREFDGEFCTKVIADGGIGWFDDIQKSLALGADAVMSGRLFNECEEACYPTFYAENYEEAVKILTNKNDEKNNDFSNMLENVEVVNFPTIGLKKYREYFGMSTRIAQKLTGGEGNKTSEGINKPTEVKYPVAKFINNLEAYLRSCMSYTGSMTIDEFRKYTDLIILGGSGDSTYRK